MDLRVSFNRAVTKGLELVTGTRINEGEPNEINAVDVNIANASDIEVSLEGEGIATETTLALLKSLKIISKDITSSDLTTNAYTFSSPVDAVAVKNDGTSDLTVTISTLTFTIKPGESRVLELAAFTVVTFSALAVFRMNGLRRT